MIEVTDGNGASPAKRFSPESWIYQEHPSILTVIVISLVGAIIAALLEIGGAFCLSASFFFWYGLAWTVPQVPFLIYRASARKACFLVAFWAVLVVLCLVPWNSRKAFLRDFEKVKIGMSQAEVEALMVKYIEGTGWPAIGVEGGSGTLREASTGVALKTTATEKGELAIEDALVYRHSDEGSFNSDWGVIRIEGGRVIAKVFLPD